MTTFFIQLAFAGGLATTALSGNAETNSTVQRELQAAPCVVSIAHGKNLSSSNVKANDFWNAMNGGLQKFFDEKLKASDVKIVSEFYPVEAADPAAKLSAVLKLAKHHSCTMLLQLSAFYAKDNELAVEISLHSLVATRDDERKGTLMRVGEPLYESKYKYDTRGAFADTFVPSSIAVGYANDLLAGTARP
jgi:hypothetical protein